MRVVIALGGNALLRRGEPPAAETQRRSVARAAEALIPLAVQHALVITHGNGPQVGLLALQAAQGTPGEGWPLDVLDAETEGMIGYLIQQEMGNRLPAGRRCVTLATQVEVAADDSAFQTPTKPIGPVYGEAEARALAAQRGWTVAPDGAGFRRVVSSPRPVRILEIDVIRLLVEQGVIVVCAGGGGIPVIRRADGSHVGIEAVIDKDLSSALLARDLGADALLMLTDVAAVETGWGTPTARRLRHIAPEALDPAAFAAGSMRPKIEAAIEFVTGTGGIAAIGRLEDAAAVLAGEAGTRIRRGAGQTVWWD